MSDHNSNNPSMTNRGQNRTRIPANFTIHDDNPIPKNSPYPNRRRANTEVLDRRGWSWNEEERKWLLSSPPRPSTTQPIRSPTTTSQHSQETHEYVRLVGGRDQSQYNTNPTTSRPGEPRHEGDPSQNFNQYPEWISSPAPGDTNLAEEIVEEAPKKRKRDIIRGVLQGFTSRLNRRSKDGRDDEGSRGGRRRASTMPSLSQTER